MEDCKIVRKIKVRFFRKNNDRLYCDFRGTIKPVERVDDHKRYKWGKVFLSRLVVIDFLGDQEIKNE